MILRRCAGHSSHVTNLRFNGDGRLLVTTVRIPTLCNVIPADSNLYAQYTSTVALVPESSKHAGLALGWRPKARVSLRYWSGVTLCAPGRNGYGDDGLASYILAEILKGTASGFVTEKVILEVIGSHMSPTAEETAVGLHASWR